MAGVEQAREEPKLRWLRRAPAGIVTSASAGGRPEPSAPRLGVLSGTFNPPTRAHLALAEHASRELRLDEVLFVLPETPPHKKQLEASLEDRAEMLLRALAGSKEFSAAIATHGLFLDIHRALAPHYPPGTRVFFLVGEDAAERTPPGVTHGACRSSLSSSSVLCSSLAHGGQEKASPHERSLDYNIKSFQGGRGKQRERVAPNAA